MQQLGLFTFLRLHCSCFLGFFSVFMFEFFSLSLLHSFICCLLDASWFMPAYPFYSACLGSFEIYSLPPVFISLQNLISRRELLFECFPLLKLCVCVHVCACMHVCLHACVPKISSREYPNIFEIIQCLCWDCRRFPGTILFSHLILFNFLNIRDNESIFVLPTMYHY